MNWGVKVTIAFVLFAGFILYMVVRSFQQNIDLVSDTYYLEEINYQDRIDQKANLTALGEKAMISQVSSDNVLIEFPTAHADATGQIHFYHVSRDIFDKRFQVETDSLARQSVGVGKLVAGRYRVKLSWTAVGKDYHQESEIFIK